LGGQNGDDHGKESSNNSSIGIKLLPDNSPYGMIQYGHVLNDRHPRFSFVGKHIKPEISDF